MSLRREFDRSKKENRRRKNQTQRETLFWKGPQL
jgi:hypothetical protein